LKKVDHNIGIERKTPFFLQKLGKIAENCDHNIDIRFGAISPFGRYNFAVGTNFCRQKSPKYLRMYVNPRFWLLFVSKLSEFSPVIYLGKNRIYILSIRYG
jgi:hypothetical protein